VIAVIGSTPANIGSLQEPVTHFPLATLPAMEWLASNQVTAVIIITSASPGDRTVAQRLAAFVADFDDPCAVLDTACTPEDIEEAIDRLLHPAQKPEVASFAELSQPPENNRIWSIAA